MPSDKPTEPPDEPHHKSEPHLLSPASPKPIHFPAPTNIPVLENMMDVGFNQTEAHMSDPSMRITEVRPDFWRDNNDQHASPGEAPPASGQNAIDTSPNNNVAVVPADDSLPSPCGDSNAQPDVAAAPVSVQTPISSEVARPVVGSPLDSQVESKQIGDAVRGNAQHSLNNGQVDVQALLDSLQSGNLVSAANVAPSNESLTVATTHAHSGNAQTQLPVDESSSTPSASLGAPPSGLPPRPPPQETPLINQNYVHSQHIRDYHPHAAHSAYNPNASSVAQGNVADPSARNYVPPVPTPLSPSQGQSQYQASTVSTTNTAHSPGGSKLPVTLQMDARKDDRPSGIGSPSPEEKPWTSETQRKYDRFLEEERKYVSEGRWEQFPMGSRLFIGNLSSEKVTKRDVFHVFHHYGDLAQISIKQAYGFVQFLTPDAAAKALSLEQDLEISKPQKNRTQANARRSRSPDYPKSARPMTTDRFVPSRGGDRDRGGRDDYRPNYRSPSPRRYRDRRNERHRSRTPPDYHRGGGTRYRSPSPRHSDHDDLPLPRRQAQAVPELQIIVLDSLDRDFIAWVEKAFSSRGVSIDVLILSPRLSEQAVIRRQILEGVLAVSRLTRANQDSGKIPLQIFDRSAGTENVKFEEYDNLDPHIAVELVLRARTTQQNARAPGYGSMSGYGAQYGSQQQYGTGYNASQSYQQYQTPGGFPPASYVAPTTQMPPSNGAPPPHLQNIITSLDPGSLQSLLSAIKTPQTASTAYGTPLPTPASGHPHSQAASYPPQAMPQNFGQQQQAALAVAQQNPQAFAGYLQQQQPQITQQQPSLSQGGQPQAGAPVNMQDILARLGTYGKPA
nr:putative rna-binding protein c3h8.09c [Quercus suber]